MTTTVSTPSVIDTRTDDFRAVLSNFKLFKNEEGSHWTFAGDTSLTNLDTSMQVTLQHIWEQNRELYNLFTHSESGVLSQVIIIQCFIQVFHNLITFLGLSLMLHNTKSAS